MPGGIGWRGFAAVGSPSLILPLRSSDLAINLEIYPSEAVHGGGIGTVDGRFHSRINIALGRKVTSGRISGEVFTGSGGAAAAFLELIKRTMGAAPSDTSMRDQGFDLTTPLIISPGTTPTLQFPADVGDQSKAVVSRFTIRGNPGGIVTYDAEIISTGATPNGTLPDITSYSFEPLPQPPDDSNPLPYWKAPFNFGASNEPDLSNRITDWTIEINNNTQLVWTFNNSQFPFDVLQGLMEVTGSFSYYAPDGAFVEELEQGSSLDIPFGGITLHVPFTAVQRFPVPLPPLNTPTIRSVEFIGIANSSFPSIYFT